MFCSNCGGQHVPNAVVCPKCGASAGVQQQQYQPFQNNAVNQSNQQNQVNSDDVGGCLWVFLGWLMSSFATFILPLVLFFVWKDEYPKRAHATLMGMILSFVTGIIITVVTLVIVFAILLPHLAYY